jgi:transcriptional regulator with XRE-family HTH domain
MKTQFDIERLISEGELRNELDYERALIADRKLRVLSKENIKYKEKRKRLRDLIHAYESVNWSSNTEISDRKMRESDLAERIAEQERRFIRRRKIMIRNKLKSIGLTQQDFGKILGHNSKSYISELMNGVSPFALKDIIVIHRLLKIDLADLIPTILSHSDRLAISSAIEELNNPNLKFSSEELDIV